MQFKEFLTSKQVIWMQAVGGIGVPVLASAEVGNVADNKLVLTYSEDLDTTSVPATTDYSVNDGAANAVTAVAISGTTVTLTLTNLVTTGKTVVVSYTAGANPVKDLDGVLAENLLNEPVTNNT